VATSAFVARLRGNQNHVRICAPTATLFFRKKPFQSTTFFRASAFVVNNRKIGREFVRGKEIAHAASASKA